MKFDEVLEELKIKHNSSDPITHTLINGGKLHVPQKHLPGFYKKLISACIHKNENHQIVEKMGEFHPLVIDIDIKYKDEIHERQYTSETIDNLLSYFWAKLSDHLDLSDKQKFGEIWLMEKDKPYPCLTHKSFKSKDGIHIAFPNIHIQRRSYKVLCDLIKREKQIESILNNTCKIKPSNEENTLFDGNFTSWQPYGCSKQNESYYKLTKVFTIDEQDNPIQISDETFDLYYTDNLKIISTLSMCYHTKETISYLPQFKTILDKGFKNVPSISNNDMSDTSDPYAKKNKTIIYRLEGAELDLVKNLVPCLSEERADDYHKWLAVGMCLHNINNKLLKEWVQFSKKSESFKDGVCEGKWKTFNNSYNGQKLGIGSLKHWARCDNPKLFKKILRDSLLGKIEKTLECGTESHYRVNEVIHLYFKDQFISIDINDEWYYFNGVRWERCLKGTKLKECIHKEIWGIYNYYAKLYAPPDSEDEEDSDNTPNSKIPSNKHNQEVCVDFQKKLLKESYVKTLMSGLSHMFYRKDIMEQFDTDNNLLGFENGIYDLRENVFREGRPEDYLTLSTNIILPVNTDEDINDARKQIPNSPLSLDSLIPKIESIQYYDILSKDMNLFIDQILPIRELKDYTLRFISKCLSGENRDEGFYIWTGSGGNGKSKLVDLISKCLGDYACNLPVALLTQKRKSSGAANPEMARTRGRRFAVMQEPDVNETVNIGEMKEITGNDKIQARGLYKEPFEFIPQFKLLLMCNDLPKIPSNDDGTWRRIEAVPFISRFVSEEKVDESQNKFMRDKQLKEKLDMWVVPFIAILLREWRLYDSEGIIIPEMVKDKTNDYRNENNIIGRWIREQCTAIKSVAGVDGIEYAPTSLQTLFDAFKEWFEEEELEIKQPDKKTFKTELFKWQEGSEWGLSVGQSKKGPNGTKNTPLFNLEVND